MIQYSCPLIRFSETRDSTETLTEAVGASEKGRAGSEVRGGIKCSISLKNLLLQKKIQELEAPSRAPARSSAQGITELLVGWNEIIQCLKGPSWNFKLVMEDSHCCCNPVILCYQHRHQSYWREERKQNCHEVYLTRLMFDKTPFNQILPNTVPSALLMSLRIWSGEHPWEMESNFLIFKSVNLVRSGNLGWPITGFWRGTTYKSKLTP